MTDIVDRYLKSKRDLESAEHDAQEIVNKFLSVAEKLKDWKSVGFEAHRSRALLPVKIQMEHVPTPEQIEARLAEWRKAKAFASATEDLLTVQQRSDLGLPNRTA